ncbi:HNH endonuclease [Bdellovibrio svalbardensis]|uniref:HNH endonuclease n=1 Tax=Bdellovibrio svalbardensis TaxID=2972972 RepID=A0ABT6DN72_9BACT|nr:HNH endonuclease [Bdellovibrio svalbardensis]MDG0818091.1 HNH endonuclease [Bdellovibrio svalbardensis]
MDYFFAAASAEHQKKEKAKARELRLSQWWKQELGKGLCYHCGNRFKPAELTMDHLIPIARGGKSNKNNCVPSCKDCNSKKGYKTRAEMAMEELKASSEKSEPVAEGVGDSNNSTENAGESEEN